MSAAVEVSVSSPELAGLDARIRALAHGLQDNRPMFDSLGAELVSQAQKRIEEKGPAPDGVPWEPWKPKYAKTRHANQSLLRGEGDLLASLMHAVGRDYVEAGSNLVYAALQQLGGTPDMPPGPRAVEGRAYLGVSREGGRDLEAVVRQFVDGRIGRHLVQ